MGLAITKKYLANFDFAQLLAKWLNRLFNDPLSNGGLQM